MFCVKVFVRLKGDGGYFNSVKFLDYLKNLKREFGEEKKLWMFLELVGGVVKKCLEKVYSMFFKVVFKVMFRSVLEFKICRSMDISFVSRTSF